MKKFIFDRLALNTFIPRTFMDIDLFFKLVKAVFFLGCIAYSGFAAKTKGRSIWAWCLLAIFFNIFAVIIISFLSDLNEDASMKSELRQLREEVTENKFLQATSLGAADSVSLCASCCHLKKLGICAQFQREIPEKVATCRYHQAS